MFDKTREFLVSLGLPAGDAFDLPTSDKRFADGAHFRIEVPTINTAVACKALLEEADRIGVTINRIDETYGAFRHTLEELKEYVAICKHYGVALNLSVGPRAAYDTSATRMSEQGRVIAYRLRGEEQIVRAIEDVKRIAEIGCRGVLVYDEGLLWVLNEMRKAGELPANMKFKNSAHNGQGNPASFKLLERLGADSINPVRDLSLPMLAALRQTVNVPLDLHTDNPPGSGGFIRVYEAPEMVRVAAPV
ncbi:MAG: peptidase, partial [Firmicutes bacterium]|nr:peptidase [Bacillota bacterium]